MWVSLLWAAARGGDTTEVSYQCPEEARVGPHRKEGELGFWNQAPHKGSHFIPPAKTFANRIKTLDRRKLDRLI